MILTVLERYWSWTPDRPVSDRGWTKVRCPSPDHDDDTASASVSIEEGRFRCFACGARGTALEIVMDEEDVSRDDAIGILSELDPVSASAILPRTTPRVARRRVFGDGAGTGPGPDHTVRARVFRRD